MQCQHCERAFADAEFRFCPYDGHRLEVAGARRVVVSRTQQEGILVGGRYRIRGFFARGAMARVYLAEDERSGELVAVKMLDRSLGTHAEMRERFRREAAAVRQIQHVNIVRIFDVGETDAGRPYIVMEFLYGESVGDHLAREGKMERAMAFTTLVRSAEALWAAHQRGIVHRDVKPDNIYLVGEPGSAFDVRLLDFGLSHLWRSDLTQAGSVIGTPSYMAPEQVCADPTDQRTDGYALGLVMYRMFAGRLPFVTNDERQMVAKQLLARPPAPSRFNPSIDPQLERVILTAIHKQPEQRYPSMQLFLRDVSQLAKQPVGKASLWAPEVTPGSYPLNTPSARFAGEAFRKLL